MADHIEVLRQMLESAVWCGSPEDRDALWAAIRALESLRGGGGFQLGDRVEWQSSQGTWFPAKIVAINHRITTYDAKLDDGCDAQDFAAGRFRKIGQQSTTPELPEGEGGEMDGYDEVLLEMLVESEKYCAALDRTKTCITCDVRRKVVHAAIRAIAAVPQPQDEEWPECSGDPKNCPENEGFGCCKSAGDITLTVAAKETQDPVLDKPARIGATVFTAGVLWSTVIDRAQREYEWHENPPFPNADMDGLRKLLDTHPASGGVEETRLLERARAAVRVLRTILHKGNLRTGAEVSDQLLTDLDSFIVANSAPTPSPTSARELPEGER